MILDDGGDATTFVLTGLAAEKDPSILNVIPDNEEERALFNQLKKSLKRDPHRFSRIVPKIIGVTEETTTGIHKLYQLQIAGSCVFQP